MSAKTIITEKEYKEILKMIKRNKNKRIDKKLNIIKLRYEGLSNKEISEKLDCNISTITRNISAFKNKGINEFTKSKYGGNRRSLTEEEEDEILKKFEERAEKGEIITVKEIKKEFDDKIGKDTGNSYIYVLLKRKGFRKVMPRTRHPKKASSEAIEASKKLKIEL